jgi:hypothetical protein
VSDKTFDAMVLMADNPGNDYEPGELARRFKAEQSVVGHILRHHCAMGRLHNRGNGAYRISADGIRWVEQKQQEAK